MDDPLPSLNGMSNEKVQAASPQATGPSSSPSHAHPSANQPAHTIPHTAPNPLPAHPYNVKAAFNLPNDIELEVQLIRDIKVENEKCTSYAPTVFKKLRKIYNIAPTVYKVSNCKSEYSRSL